MLLVRTVLLVLHITAAAVSFGAPLGATRLLRQAAQSNPQSFALVVNDIARRVLMARVCGVVALFSGVALVFYNGGFAAVPKNYHTALLLMWLLLGIQVFITAPAVKRVKALASAAGALDATGVEACARRMGMGVGMGHALWAVILVLMFERF